MASTARTGIIAARALLVLLLLGLSLGASPTATGSAAPVPSLVVIPSSGIVDGQLVTVEATNLPLGEFIAVPCAAGAVDLEECSLDSFDFWFEVDADSPTTISRRVRVLARLHLDGSSMIDCRTPGACELVLVDVSTMLLVPGVRAPLVFDPTGALMPTPVGHASPTTDLIDGQVVVVEVSNLPPHGFANVEQCAESSTGTSCRMLAWLDADSSGKVTTSVSVRTILSWGGGTNDPKFDCRTPDVTCSLVVVGSMGLRSDPIPLSFDPDGPLLPDPTVTLDPSGPIVDGAPVTVSGTGFSASEELMVQFCPVGTQEGCDPTVDEWLQADSEGLLSLELVLYGTYDHYEGSVDCRVAPGCELTISRFGEATQLSVPLTFAPAPPSKGRYLDPVFTDVGVTRDIVYRTATTSQGETVELQLDIYQPAGDTATERPVMIWLHGGFFVFGHRSEMDPYAMASARRGYVAVLVSYRLRPEVSTSDLAGVVEAAGDAYDDTTAAIEWLEANADTYRIDTDAVFAGGVSAGGVLAWNLNFLPGEQGPATPLVDAVVPISGLAFGSPSAGDVPIISFHATDDPILPYDPPRQSCEAAVAVGVVCEWVGYPSGGHYIAISQYRNILDRTHAFLFEQVLAPLGYTNQTGPIRPGPTPVDPPPPAGPEPTVPEPLVPGSPLGPPSSPEPPVTPAAPPRVPSGIAPATGAEPRPHRPDYTG